MEIIKKRIADMERAEYNPRVELMPGDDEYEKLKRNIDRFGVVVPVIWNKRTNRVVSGHQRLTVLMNEGVTETDVSVVDLDETAEKQLNIAMNKVTGEWDEVKLKELLDGLGDAAPETGFDLYEIEALENNVDALVDGDFLDSELKSIEETFNISLKFSAEDRDVLKEYIKDNGKDERSRNRRTVQDAEPERGQRAQNCKAELLRPDAGGACQKDRLPQKGVWTG